MRSGALTPITEPSASLTHGPAALTSIFALAGDLAPVDLSSSANRQRPASRLALTQRVRVLMSAPRSAASRALSTTRRASSTQQSEYSKARVNSDLSGPPAESRVRSRLLVGGRILRPPR